MFFILSCGTLSRSSAQSLVKGFEEHDYYGLPYRLWRSGESTTSGYKVVIYLHGAGEKGSNNTRQIQQNSELLDSLTAYITQHKLHCIVIAPQCPFDDQWVQTEFGHGTYLTSEAGFSPPLMLVSSLISEFRDPQQFDTSSFYLMGLSMGGYGVWDLLQRFPELFAAAIPVCGAADTTRADVIAKTPTWVFHGLGDQVVPVSGSRDIVNQLGNYGANVRYTEYEGEQHIIWPRVAQEPALFDWLFSKNKLITEDPPELRTSTTLVLDGISGDLTIEGGDWRQGQLSLYDICGRESFKKQVDRNARERIRLEMLQHSQVHFCIFRADNGEVVTAKFPPSRTH